MKDELNAKEEQFCQDMLLFPGADPVDVAEAYRKSHKSTAKLQSLKNQGKRLYNQPRIQKRMAELRAPIIAAKQLEESDAIDSLARMLVFDPRKLFDDRGEPLPPHKLDDDTALALKGVKVRKVISGGRDNETETITYEYTGHDKNSTANLLMQHLGMIGNRLPPGKGGAVSDARLTGKMLIRRVTEIIQFADQQPEAARVFEHDQSLLSNQE